MARNTTTLRRQLSVGAFYKLSHDIAADYANTAASTARTVLMERYNVTESTFYHLLSVSITHSLVSDDTVTKILEKILANQSAHGNNGYKSKLKHNKLLEERKNYSAFTKKDIEHIARYYANHPEMTKKEVARVFHFHSTAPLDQLLLIACNELIISDSVFEALRTRSMKNPKNLQYTISFFDGLAKNRAEKKMAIKAKKKGQSSF